MTAPEFSLHLPSEWSGIIGGDDTLREAVRAPVLHVSIDADASYKIGTCEHCVLWEQGRPDRAWDADGDKDLDFDRDRYFALLEALGIVMTECQAYVCP
ncbi:hypothetical protein [Dictyobacter formicarum]|uniref:Ferredoxin n=1 Tax=Dictyobacter formicarum TaxID=2778368 RepID=A0ABQ3VA46_9CHLR|nr:hypothetical protein [Dictyobacter formicarum]GHO82293.1 hypothetical protein KSZ_02990 [Dictyobacter formicarum]